MAEESTLASFTAALIAWAARSVAVISYTKRERERERERETEGLNEC